MNHYFKKISFGDSKNITVRKVYFISPLLMSNMVTILSAMYESTERKPLCSCKRHKYNQCMGGPEVYIQRSLTEEFLISKIV